MNCRENPLVMKRQRLFRLTLDAVSRLSEIYECALLKAFTTLDEKGWSALCKEQRGKEKKILFVHPEVKIG